jgi:hypothetical protein
MAGKSLENGTLAFMNPMYGVVMPLDLKRFIAHDKKKMDDAAKRAKEEELEQADIPDSDDDLPELLPNDEFARTFGTAPNETPETGIWGISSAAMGDTSQTDWSLTPLGAATERGGNHLLAKLKERGHTCWVRYPTGFLDWCHKEVCTGERMDLGLVSPDVHMRDAMFDPVLEGEKRARLAPTAPTWPPAFKTPSGYLSTNDGHRQPYMPWMTDRKMNVLHNDTFGNYGNDDWRSTIEGLRTDMPVPVRDPPVIMNLYEKAPPRKVHVAATDTDIIFDLTAQAKPFKPGLCDIVSSTSPLPPTLPEGALCVNGVVLFRTKNTIVDHLPFVGAFAGEQELCRATSSSSEDTAVHVNLEDGGQALVDAFATFVD